MTAATTAFNANNRPESRKDSRNVFHVFQLHANLRLRFLGTLLKIYVIRKH